MNTVLEKGNIIAKIRKGEDLDQIIDCVKSEIYQNGPNSSVVLEIVSYFKLFQPEFFKKDEQEIIATMGLFFKQPKIESLTGSVFEIYHQQLKDEFGNDYTPMQADILKKIRDLQYFSFSAPTSTGKSFVFRHLITDCSNDVVVVVPSRALINEYYDRLNSLVDGKAVNVLTFVDRINTKHIYRNIFILTPERAKELFKNKDWLKIDLILFGYVLLPIRFPLQVACLNRHLLLLGIFVYRFRFLLRLLFHLLLCGQHIPLLNDLMLFVKIVHFQK